MAKGKKAAHKSEHASSKQAGAATSDPQARGRADDGGAQRAPDAAAKNGEPAQSSGAGALVFIAVIFGLMALGIAAEFVLNR